MNEIFLEKITKISLFSEFNNVIFVKFITICISWQIFNPKMGPNELWKIFVHLSEVYFGSKIWKKSSDPCHTNSLFSRFNNINVIKFTVVCISWQIFHPKKGPSEVLKKLVRGLFWIEKITKILICVKINWDVLWWYLKSLIWRQIKDCVRCLSFFKLHGEISLYF